MANFHSLESLPNEDQLLFNRFSRGQTAHIPYKVVHHAFEAIAKNHPSITAVRHHDGTTITYGELDGRANILANELCTTYGLRKGDRVILVYARCIEMVVFILAVLKAGGQYVPLDGGVVPEGTLGFDIADSGAPVVLCLPKFRTKVLKSIPEAVKERVKVVDLDSTSSLWETGNTRRPDVEVGPDDGVYVIYTSGTTGRPKGVDVRHEGVTNSLLAEPSKLGIKVGTNVAQQLNVGFDMCAWEILGTIMNGGTLHIRGSGNDLWTDCLRRVDTVIGTPSVILKHMPHYQDFTNIRTIAVGGEPCPKTLADHWAPHADFWNFCGPTEISIVNSAHLHKPGTTLSIGRPNPNTNIYILDDYEQPVKIGEPGAMWAGGPGLSRGYINLPELTAARYKPDKFTKDGRMMFNTGDLGRWLEDGSLETLGRKDDQVKLSGFRVELDGVSKSIEKVPAVTKACALKIKEKLWGFYSAPAEIRVDELEASVGKEQPFYAVPARWKYLPVIELTANGKINKELLRQMVAAESAEIVLPASSPSESTISTLFDTEKGHTSTTCSDLSIKLDEEEEKEIYALPPKNGIHGWRWLRHKGLSAYRKLFGFIFVANLCAFVVLLWQSRDNNFSLPLPHLVTAVAANLLGAVLLRQDHVVNLIFWLATRLPLSTPLSIRRHFARIYHNGGVHSGCAVSASIWWLIFAVEATRCFTASKPGYHIDTATMVLTYLILAILMLILGMAYPKIRMKMHDQFEWTHRFAGWTTLGLVWIHLVVSTSSISQEGLGRSLAKSPGLYMVLATTLSIALPWMRLRKVKVTPEPLSRHAVRLHFDFFTPRASSSVGVRITDRPLVEWHAFAAVFQPGVKGFSIIVSRAGDWTGRIIDNPPTSIWTRGVPASGVLAIAPLFKKIVIVATGSGMGPCLPVILENRVPLRVLWSTKNPLQTYGQKVIDSILAADPDAVMWDTDKQGRPDLASLAYQLYKESGAECVCIISNSTTTAKLVYRLESRGVPAFGPIWDS